MEATEAILNRAEALITADSGTGGLVNSSSSCFLNGWNTTTPHWRVGDPDRTRYWPRIEGEVVSDVDVSPQASTAVYEVFDLVLRIHIWTKRDQGFDKQNRIAARVRTVFNRVTPSSFADTDNSLRSWFFQPFQRTGTGQAPADATSLHYVMDFRMTATKGETAIP